MRCRGTADPKRLSMCFRIDSSSAPFGILGLGQVHNRTGSLPELAYLLLFWPVLNGNFLLQAVLVRRESILCLPCANSHTAKFCGAHFIAVAQLPERHQQSAQGVENWRRLHLWVCRLLSIRDGGTGKEESVGRSFVPQVPGFQFFPGLRVFGPASIP